MRDHVYPLDVLRFFAACCVVAYHLCFFGWASDWSTTAQMLQHAARYDALAPFTWFGWVGVEIFFVISGFVIANSAYGRSPIDFLKGRILRLYPAAWICATITFCAWLAFAQAPLSEKLPEYARALSLWIMGPWIDGVYWSLATEIVFYGLVFWTLVANRLVQLTAIPWLLTAIGLAHLAMRLTPGAMTAAESIPVLSPIVGHADTFMLTFGSFFATGVWLWLLSRHEMTPLRFIGLAFALGCNLVEIALRAQEHRDAGLHTNIAMSIWPPMMLWTLAVGLIATVALAPRLFAVQSAQQQARLRRIGLMTYPLFLVHNVAGAGIIRVLTHLGINQWLALMIAISTAVALAYVICATAEVALRRQLRAVLDWAEASIRKRLAGLQSSPRA